MIKSTDTKLDTMVKLKVPNLFRVILLNDDVTPMDFVVCLIKDVFNKSIPEATDLMMKVHNEGSAVCGVYPRDVAETKAAYVREVSARHQYPLQARVEEEHRR